MIWVLFLIICIYEALDVYQSWWLFYFGAEELNPILAWGMIDGGFAFIIEFKLLFTLLLLLAILMSRRREKANL